ncbi:MAG: dimethyl sulfoxide reductase anchor subunit [Trueperella sp.]|uniref:dimethyl sulfoxide reductase anchor subunit family protein n=1 Tax=Trueperella TaxID=1069494 RepID=UPI0025D06A26|nr:MULTISPECIES: DmsC/YnfH family molybdoenzyme membrane anchor subunit [Trueperella]MCI7306480.1 dimethyl sulfoxide reductase anchor subunit [Trueperella sp.]MDY5403125.1 DmsC/YnfH family molybdoenzyme membrane anchor subunit [Trueperella sp.]
MNLHELPMIIFTVVAQLCVGMFLMLGVIQLWLATRADNRTADRLTTPILYVIGPVLVFGLVASMFHMNDVTHTLNVFRHVGSSWLSREIVFGVGFAGLGFVFAAMQWFKIAAFRVRQAVAALAALFGIALIVSMSMIYASLPTVPAWNTWVVPFQFFMTAIVLGSAGVTMSLVLMTLVRQRPAKVAPVKVPVRNSADPNAGKTWKDALGLTANKREINAPATADEWRWTVSIIRLCAALAALAAVGVLISYIAHLQNLAMNPEPAAAVSAAVFTGAFFWVRLILVGVGAVAVGFVAYKMADDDALARPVPLAAWVTAGFVVLLVAELMGRSLHYDSQQLIGIG